MKYASLAFVALFVLMASAPEASAVVCARGVYRAGCAGPHGAVVAQRPVAPVVRPGVGAAVVRPGCAWVNGRHVCR
jgi:hypothetical protein